jgi:predicted membrane protein
LFLFSRGLGESRLTVAAMFAVAAVLSAVLSLVYPKANRLLFVATSVAAFPIGFVMSYVVLGVLFFVIFAPIGALLRWTGRDPMERAFDRDKSSYWIETGRPRSRSSYFRQF